MELFSAGVGGNWGAVGSRLTPAERDSSSLQKSAGSKAAHPSAKNFARKALPSVRGWLHPSYRTMCYFHQRATRHNYRFLNIFYELT